MTPLERVLDSLEHVRRGGAGYTARCPAHDDRNPSLSIREAEDGTVLLHCHAGCRFEDICAALGLQPRELFAGSAAPRLRTSEPMAGRADDTATSAEDR